MRAIKLFINRFLAIAPILFICCGGLWINQAQAFMSKTDISTVKSMVLSQSKQCSSNEKIRVKYCILNRSLAGDENSYKCIFDKTFGERNCNEFFEENIPGYVGSLIDIWDYEINRIYEITKKEYENSPYFPKSVYGSCIPRFRVTHMALWAKDNCTKKYCDKLCTTDSNVKLNKFYISGLSRDSHGHNINSAYQAIKVILKDTKNLNDNELNNTLTSMCKNLCDGAVNGDEEIEPKRPLIHNLITTKKNGTVVISPWVNKANTAWLSGTRDGQYFLCFNEIGVFWAGEPVYSFQLLSEKYYNVCGVLLNVGALYGSKSQANKVILGCINKNAISYNKDFGNPKTSSSQKNSILSKLRTCFNTKRTGSPNFPPDRLSYYLNGITGMFAHAESLDNGHYHHSMENYRKCIAPCGNICHDYAFYEQGNSANCMKKCKKPCEQFSKPKNISPQDLKDAGIAIGSAGEAIGNAVASFSEDVWNSCADDPFRCSMSFIPAGDLVLIGYDCMSGSAMCNAADIGITLGTNFVMGTGSVGKLSRIAMKKIGKKLMKKTASNVPKAAKKAAAKSLRKKIGKKVSKTLTTLGVSLANPLDTVKKKIKKEAFRAIQRGAINALVYQLFPNTEHAQRDEVSKRMFESFDNTGMV